MRHSVWHKCVCSIVAIAFIGTMVMPPQSHAQTMLALPEPGALVNTSPAYTPVMMTGVRVHPDNPFKFDFVIDSGHSNLSGESLENETKQLIKYFLSSLTIPKEDLWVNLSPYEKDRIVPDAFGVTEMGRDMLAQDYLLKQFTSSMTSPDSELGKNFWDKVYQKAYDQFGTTDVPVDTFNKVWIVPKRAFVYEQDETAVILNSKMEVLMEEDYEAMTNQKDIAESRAPARDLASDSSLVTRSSNRDTGHEPLATDLMKQIILPQIEHEVNNGQHFAQLRQIYNALILATWYKNNLKDSILNKIYSDKRATAGVDINDKDEKQKIYNQYLEAFKTGVYNYIKEEYDPNTQQVMPRKYFSGGMNMDVDKAMFTTRDPDIAKKHLTQHPTFSVSMLLQGVGPKGKKIAAHFVQKISRTSAQMKHLFDIINDKDDPDHWVVMLNDPQKLVFFRQLGMATEKYLQFYFHLQSVLSSLSESFTLDQKTVLNIAIILKRSTRGDDKIYNLLNILRSKSANEPWRIILEKPESLSLTEEKGRAAKKYQEVYLKLEKVISSLAEEYDLNQQWVVTIAEFLFSKMNPNVQYTYNLTAHGLETLDALIQNILTSENTSPKDISMLSGWRPTLKGMGATIAVMGLVSLISIFGLNNQPIEVEKEAFLNTKPKHILMAEVPKMIYKPPPDSLVRMIKEQKVEDEWKKINKNKGKVSMQNGLPTLDIGQADSINEIASLIHRLPNLKYGEGHKFHHISGTNIIFTIFESIFEQMEMFDRIALFAEVKGYVGKILTDDQMNEAKKQLGKQSIWAGHDYPLETIALFFTLAEADGVKLNDLEIALRDFLLNTGEGAIQETSPGVYVAKPNVAIIGFPQNTRYVDDKREYIIQHELSHAWYFTHPEYRQDVRDLWNETSFEMQNVVLDFLESRGYDTSNEDLVLTEFAAHFRDADMMKDMHSGDYNKYMNGNMEEGNKEAAQRTFSQTMHSSKQTFFTWQYDKLQADPMNPAYMDDTGKMLMNTDTFKTVYLDPEYEQELYSTQQKLQAIENLQQNRGIEMAPLKLPTFTPTPKVDSPSIMFRGRPRGPVMLSRMFTSIVTMMKTEGMKEFSKSVEEKYQTEAESAIQKALQENPDAVAFKITHGVRPGGMKVMEDGFNMEREQDTFNISIKLILPYETRPDQNEEWEEFKTAAAVNIRGYPRNGITSNNSRIKDLRNNVIDSREGKERQDWEEALANFIKKHPNATEDTWVETSHGTHEGKEIRLREDDAYMKEPAKAFIKIQKSDPLVQMQLEEHERKISRGKPSGEDMFDPKNPASVKKLAEALKKQRNGELKDDGRFLKRNDPDAGKKFKERWEKMSKEERSRSIIKLAEDKEDNMMAAQNKVHVISPSVEALRKMHGLDPEKRTFPIVLKEEMTRNVHGSPVIDRRKVASDGPTIAPPSIAESKIFSTNHVEREIRMGQDAPNLHNRQSLAQPVDMGHVHSNRASMPTEDSIVLQRQLERNGRIGADATKGGVDFNPDALDLQVDGKGDGIKWDFDPSMIGNIKVEGFTPIIIDVAPIKSLPLFLGIYAKDDVPADKMDVI